MPRPTPEAIDALLPQTQCGECGYDGCLPYARALAAGTAAGINLCRPGGERVMALLADFLGVMPLAPAKPKEPPLMARIDASRCIGCTLCIQACPTDCIEGAPRQAHAVRADDCTGCRLCLAPCPVDCIDIVDHSRFPDVKELPPEALAAWEAARASEVRRLFLANEDKIARGDKRRLTRRPVGGYRKRAGLKSAADRLREKLAAEQMDKIAAARERAREKWSKKQAATPRLLQKSKKAGKIPSQE